MNRVAKNINLKDNEVKERPTVLDLFSGCGGFSLGFYLSGFNILAHVEKDDFSIRTFENNIPSKEYFHGDVNSEEFFDKIKIWANKYVFDVIIAGPPCQGFSVAGVSWVTRDKRHSLNNLYLIPIYVAKILKEHGKQPKAVIIENVPTVLAPNNIPLVVLTLFRLKELGYNTFPEPPEDINQDILENFYDLTQEITHKLTDLGITSKKQFLSNLGNLITIRNKIIEFFQFVPKTPLFDEFYSKYHKKIFREQKNGQLTKIRIDKPIRMKQWLEKRKIKISIEILKIIDQEVQSLLLFFEKKGLVLDNLSFGNKKLLNGLIIFEKMGLNIDAASRLKKESINDLESEYKNLLEKINLWGKNNRDTVIFKSENYGAPQKRPRAFIIAVKKNFDISSSPKLVINDKKFVKLGEAIGDLPVLLPGEGTDYFQKYPENFYSKKLTEYQKEMRGKSKSIMNHRARSINDVFYLIRYAMLFEGANDLIFPYYLQKLDKKQFVDAWKRLDSDKISSAIVAHLSKDGNAFIHPFEERTLTVREAARIQGFPDSFIFPPEDSFSEHFRQIGNAVSVQVATNIAVIIRNMIKEYDNNKKLELKPKIKETWLFPEYINKITDLNFIRGGKTEKKTGMYKIKKFNEKEAKRFIEGVEYFQLGKLEQNKVIAEKITNGRNISLIWKENDSKKLDNNLKIELLPIKSMNQSNLMKKRSKNNKLLFEIKEIIVERKKTGYLGIFTEENDKKTWFTTFSREISWNIQRIVLKRISRLFNSYYIMMNKSNDFFLSFISFIFSIENAGYRIPNDKKISKNNANLKKYMQDKSIIKGKSVELFLKMFETVLNIKIRNWQRVNENLAVEIFIRVEQEGRSFEVLETIVNQAPSNIILENFSERDNFETIRDYDRVRSNILLLFSHLLLFKKGKLDIKDFSYFWGENNLTLEKIRYLILPDNK